jgi:predicted RNase H-like nuclease (RuvC/YqgF family)
VEKLVQLGNQKGITDDRTHSKKKKKREEEKRVKDLVEFQMEQERKKHTKEINTKEESIQMLNQLLYEEQTISANLRDELKRYRDEMGEVFGFLHMSTICTVSRDQIIGQKIDSYLNYEFPSELLMHKKSSQSF